MNTRKLRKAILTLCSALLLVSLSVGMTLAYLTDTESVKNTFSVGNVGLDMDETDVWDTEDIGTKYNENGAEKTVTKEMVGEVKPGNTKRVKENDYQLYPGKTYKKDPIITIDKGSEDCWVIAKIVVTATEISKVRELIGYNGGLLGLNGIVSGGVFTDSYGTPTEGDNGVTTWTGTDYTLTQKAETDKNVFYVYVNAAQKANASIALFDTITIPNTWGNDEIAKLAGLKMDISAYAVQKDSFVNAQEAFKAAFPNN